MAIVDGHAESTWHAVRVLSRGDHQSTTLRVSFCRHLVMALVVRLERLLDRPALCGGRARRRDRMVSGLDTNSSSTEEACR